MTRSAGCTHEMRAIFCKWIKICATNVDKLEAGERLAVEADCTQKINPFASRACSFNAFLMVGVAWYRELSGGVVQSSFVTTGLWLNEYRF